MGEVRKINGRILHKNQIENITIINVYAPTENNAEEEKEKVILKHLKTLICQLGKFLHITKTAWPGGGGGCWVDNTTPGISSINLF